MIGKEKMASYIDQTLLKPETTLEDIEKFCQEAKMYNFYSVYVNPSYIESAVDVLKDSSVKIGVPIGFPLGASQSKVKAFEAKTAVASGAQEVDMVINLGLLKDGDFYALREDIEGVVVGVKEIDPKVKVKVILETCYLNENELVSACHVAQDAGAHFVKTSTGFGPGGATIEDIKLMKSVVGEALGVKASGGIRDLTTALAMIEAGATRIGTSSGISIIDAIGE